MRSLQLDRHRYPHGMTVPSRDELRRLPPPSAPDGPTLSPLMIAVIALALGGVVGGVIGGHLMLARVRRDGGEGDRALKAIVVGSWIGLACLTGLLLTVTTFSQ